MSAGAQIDWQNDPGFQQLPLMEKHKALLAIDSGYKALPPAEQVKALTAVHGATHFEKNITGEGISLKGSGTAAWDTLKNMVPQGPTGPVFSKEFWIGKPEDWRFDPAHSGIVEAGREAGAGWQRAGGDVRAKIGEAVPAFLGRLLGVSASQQAENASHGEGGKIIGETGVPAAITALSPLAEVLPGKVGALASKAKEAGMERLQKTLGVGPELTEQAVKDWQGKTADVSEANRQSLLRARGEHEGKIGDIEEQNRIKRQEALQDYQAKSIDVQQQNIQSLSKARQGEEAFQSKVEAVKQANEQNKANFQQRQQLVEEARGHAEDFGKSLEQLHQDEIAKGKAMFPDVSGTVPAEDVLEALADAKGKLQGTTKAPPVLERMIKNITPDDPLAQASVFKGAGKAGRNPMVMGKPLSEYPQEFQRQFAQRFPEEGERGGYASPEASGAVMDVPYKQLRGLSSELGDEIANANLAPDERAALVDARSKIDGMSRKLADNEGKLGQFETARDNWKNLERTFHKTWSDRAGVASPIAKALQMRNPATGDILPGRLMDVMGKDENYSLAQKLLGKYGNAGSDVLQLMKEKLDMSKGLPAKLTQGQVPERSFAPISLKAPPEMGEVPQKRMPDYQSISLKAPPEAPDVQSMKADVLRKKAEMLGGFSGRGMFIDAASVVHFLTTGNPLALSIPIGRRLLARAIKSGTGSLVALTPEEAALLKNAQQGGAPKSIPPSKVYPSAKVAAKAGGEIPQGKPTPFGESELDQATRRAAGPSKSMSEEVREAEARTAAEKEAKRQAWEKEQAAKRKKDKQ